VREYKIPKRLQRIRSSPGGMKYEGMRRPLRPGRGGNRLIAGVRCAAGVRTWPGAGATPVSRGVRSLGSTCRRGDVAAAGHGRFPGVLRPSLVLAAGNRVPCPPASGI
jgi:hypothetical protein